jgi:hypothetical protein
MLLIVMNVYGHVGIKSNFISIQFMNKRHRTMRRSLHVLSVICTTNIVCCCVLYRCLFYSHANREEEEEEEDKAR